MKKIAAVDFDGTVVRHEYPEIGADVEGAVEVLKRLRENDVQIILWTMRSGGYLENAVQWFTERGIELWGVNENPEQKEWTNSPKAYAPLYIDDAALGCPLLADAKEGRPFVNWMFVEIELERKGLLPERLTALAPDTDLKAALHAEAKALGMVQ